jgi:hypothetical protein
MNLAQYLDTNLYKEPTFTFEGWDELDLTPNCDSSNNYNSAQDLECILDFLREFYSTKNLNELSYSLTEVYEIVEDLVYNSQSQELHQTLTNFYTNIFDSLFTSCLEILNSPSSDILNYLTDNYIDQLDRHKKISQIFVIFEKSYLQTKFSKDFLKDLHDLMRSCFTNPHRFSQYKLLLSKLSDEINEQLNLYSEDQSVYNHSVNVVITMLKNINIFSTVFDQQDQGQTKRFSMQSNIIENRKTKLTGKNVLTKYPALDSTNGFIL